MPASLSLNAIRSRCAVFVHDWNDCVGDEKQEGHEFMRELMKCFGITKRKAIAYEKRSNRASTGRQGYIDALIPGKALIEMKSAGKDLDKAEEQALDYIHDLADIETPRLLIISDFRRIRIIDLDHDMTTTEGIESGRTEFELVKLPDHVDDLKSLAGYGMVQVGSREQEQASIRAARVMADLYEALDGSGYSDHEASIFLIRTLFCLYGDDAGLWERDLFTEFLDTRTHEDGSDLGAQLALLYQTLNTPAERRQSTLDELISRFPYVNGGIFAEPLSIPSFSSAMHEELVRAPSTGLTSAPPSSDLSSRLSSPPRPVANSVSTTRARRTFSRRWAPSSSTTCVSASQNTHTISPSSRACAKSSASYELWIPPAAAATSWSSPTESCATWIRRS